MQAEAIEGLITEMAQAIKTRLEVQQATEPAMIGIHTGGVWLAERLHRLLNIEQPLGTLDISFYRDDFTRIGMNPKVKPSQIPFEVEDRHIILVDDVLQTGRTIRAAMNEIFDYGRPASIILATLVERSGRELPIQPSIVGVRPPLTHEQQITLTGPDPLNLIIGTSKQETRGTS
ncbi:MAG: bifunctional pyr operon transcriptional regulator/uracil phosphoribosyltransferase PyrR [Sedimenticola sp.]|nr:bifunctional pyr operon transcriptional regulator/uracil phosphoribosyltransferase PyrR [Sedimenticola sp.]